MAQLVLKLQFSNQFATTSKGSPIFLRHRGVAGSLKVLNIVDSGIDKIKLVLRGIVKNSIHYSCLPYSQPNPPRLSEHFLELIEVKLVTSSQRSARNDSTDSFPFHFVLHKKALGPFNNNNNLAAYPTNSFSQLLPSSIRIDSPRCSEAGCGGGCRVDCKVKYEVQASVYSRDVFISRTSKEILLFDGGDSLPPPIDTADFPEEFVCKQERKLKKLLVGGHRRLSVLVTEPKPVEIRRPDDIILAAFPFRFMLSDKAETLKHSFPGPLEVHISSIVKSTTICSVVRMSSQITIHQANRDACAAAVSKYFTTFHRKLNVSHWTKGRYAVDSAVEDAWFKDVVIWLPVFNDIAPPPSFFAPWVCRRYSVLLKIEIESVEDGKAKCDLIVPLQVTYPLDMDTPPPGYEVAVAPAQAGDNDEMAFDEVPTYIR